MQREEMLSVVSDLMDVLNGRKVSPDDAESIAYIFQKAVEDSINKGMVLYKEQGIFKGTPPTE